MGSTTWFLLLTITIAGVHNKQVKRTGCSCSSKALKFVNECANSTLNNCHPNATCIDLPTSFSCTCNEGFTGNGTFCTADLGLCNGTVCNEGENRTCYLNESCVCIPGFHELNGTCVESCDTYGNTFIEYPTTELVCDPTLNSIFAPPSTLAECQAECTANSSCISIAYVPSTGFCFVYGCDPLAEDAFFELISDTNTFVRNCA